MRVKPAFVTFGELRFGGSAAIVFRAREYAKTVDAEVTTPGGTTRKAR
jgi:pyrroline-5-carboxylate reductase